MGFWGLLHLFIVLLGFLASDTVTETFWRHIRGLQTRAAMAVPLCKSRPNELLQDFVHQQYQDLPSMCFFPMRCVDNLDSKSSKLRTAACFNPFTRADNCTVSFCCFHATYDQKQYRARPFQPPMPLTVIPQ